MALGDVIARLSVVMGLETAAFERGANIAEKRLAQTKRQFETLGKSIGGIGKTLSLGITAPLLGMGAALSHATKSLVASSREMQTASQVAGEGFEDFQRLAFAAETVGIEAGKLGDIFKDVQDKVGDFRATGGGGMADFFENIAPKVELTAEAFRGLSGKDGLQLYYDSLVKANVSSDEMRFYLEAIASDATMLIPLLEKGGRAFDELGKSASVVTEEDSARLEKFALASAKMEAAVQNLTIALVGSGLLEAVTGIVTKITDWTNWLATINPEILNWGLAIGGVTAAIGPLLVGMGAIMAHPLILAGAVTIGAIFYAWKNWERIGPILMDLFPPLKGLVRLLEYMEPLTDRVGRAISDRFGGGGSSAGGSGGVRGALAALTRSASQAVPPVSGLTSQVNQLATSATSAGASTNRMADDFRNLMDRIYPEVTRLRTLREELDLLRGSLSGDALADAQSRLRFDVAGESATSKVGLSDQVREALFGQGELGGLDKAQKSFERFTDRMKRDADAAKVTIVRTFGEMAQQTLAAFDRLAGAIKGGGFLDILSSVVGVGLQLGGAGVFGKSIAGRINAFANGTSFAPGGLSLVGERGPELVDLPRGARVTPNNQLGGMGGVVVINNSPMVDVFVDGRIQHHAPGIAEAGAQVAMSRMAFQQSRRLG